MPGVVIVNEPMECDAKFSFSDAEVDCIARTITGKVKKIKSQDITDFMQVVLERVVMNGVTTKPSDDDWLDSRTKNMTSEQKRSYIRGWRAVGKAIEEHKNA